MKKRKQPPMRTLLQILEDQLSDEPNILNMGDFHIVAENPEWKPHHTTDLEHPLFLLMLFIADCLKVPIDKMILVPHSGRGNTTEVTARQVYCWIARKYFSPRYTLNFIGSFIGLTHADVLHSAKKMNESLEIKDRDVEKVTYGIEKWYTEWTDFGLVEMNKHLAGKPIELGEKRKLKTLNKHRRKLIKIERKLLKNTHAKVNSG